CGAAAAYGLGHHRGPGGHGREGDRQHPLSRRRPQTAGSRDPGDALATICLKAQFGREAFWGLGRSVARSVLQHVSTRDEPKTQKDRALFERGVEKLNELFESPLSL